MMLSELLQEKREEILRICAKYGAQNVRVFGSVARGEADERSDIDLLVEFEPGRSLLDHAGLWLELQEVLGYRVDVVSERGIKPRIRERVLREAVPLLRDPVWDAASRDAPALRPHMEQLLQRLEELGYGG